jgi:glycosyltransferase involved in cell wall biosynthesis
MPAQALVTVVVPCLNRVAFLRPTLDSILGQDYPLVECIVVDGGSTDGTLDVLTSYGERIRWVSEPDGGHADAINKGWRRGRGEVLAWLNADDVWEVPSAARTAVEYLAAHPEVDVVYGDCGAIDAEGRPVGMTYLHEWDLASAVELCDHCIPQPAAFIRRSTLDRVGYLDTAFYQKKDHELWLRIGLVGTIRHIPQVTAHERQIRGLSYDAATAVPACLQVTRKFFSLDGVPEPLRRRKRRAISNSHLRGVDYAAIAGSARATMLRCAILGFLADPTNLLGSYRRLALYRDQFASSPIWWWLVAALWLARLPKVVVDAARAALGSLGRTPAC